MARHVPPKARDGYRRAAELLRALTRPPTRDLPGESIEQVLEGGYEEYLRTEFLNADSRVEDIRQLADYARGYEDAEAFLSEIALLTELTAETVAEGEEPDEKMVLSSVHQAKGLEWRAVFVVWLADGRFPSAQALRDPDGEEEERRLFYVACTRAKDELYALPTRWWPRRATGSGWSSRPRASSRSCPGEPAALRALAARRRARRCRRSARPGRRRPRCRPWPCRACSAAGAGRADGGRGRRPVLDTDVPRGPRTVLPVRRDASAP